MEMIQFFIKIWPELYKGLLVSLQLSAGALLLGLAIGLPMALARTYGKGLVKTLATAYIEIIRGTPMIVQLFIIYYGLPDFGILLDRMPAAIIALGINSSAYQAEYFRGAILSIDEGQGLAAQALGMTKSQTIVNIILPQALRLVLPPWSNELIYMVKYTSVAFLIAVPELMARGKMIITQTFKPMETLFWVGAIYVVVLSVIAKAVDIIEKKLAIPGFQMSRED
ncbi:MAG: amino acid ABC transporter permease [Tepidanaerobacter acetatoxydans]|jgi:polar amino acid transport system permease protein|uniref:amino acid ABC transporter permease n=1 Tax=Tepidanaerobacter TaxID=499228 RepID=UPI000B2AAC7B|nr:MULTISPECIES: amino acid ABC transporter permease [Tepidanaerobacter]NLU09713.1 amino acid ABC transporter permease [Tepidanaerobacter acetatoxydans]